MTNLGKTIVAVAAVGILVSVGLAVRAERQEPPRAAAPGLTPAQRTELFKPEPQQPKIAPAMHYESPAVEAPEDGNGS
jgi:hypothetical protein